MKVLVAVGMILFSFWFAFAASIQPVKRFSFAFGPEMNGAEFVFSIDGENVALCVSDLENEVVSQRCLTDDEKAAGKVVLSAEDVGNWFGAFKLTVAAKKPDGTTDRAETWFARLTSDATPACHWIGTYIDNRYCLKRENFGFIDLMAKAGIGCIRGEIMGWGAVEPVKGRYSMDAVADDYINALAARDIKLLYLLSHISWGEKFYKPEEIPEAFANYVAFVGEHFKGRVDRFEILNEPGNFYFPKRFGKETWMVEYLKIAKAARDKLHAVRPDATVGVCSEDWWPRLSQMLSGGLADDFSLITIHPYCHSQIRPECEPLWFKDHGSRMKALMAKNGGCKRVAVSEVGWTTYEGKGAFAAVAGGYPRSSLNMQARYLIREYILARQEGLEFVCQYNFCDSGSRREYTEHNFGMTHEDWSPKPSFAAIAELSRRVGRAEPLGDFSYQSKKFRLYGWRSAVDETFVGWAIEKDVEVELPRSQDVSRLCGFDIYGNPVALPLEGRNLKLTEDPIYIRGLDSAALKTVPRTSLTVPNDAPALGEPMSMLLEFDADSWTRLAGKPVKITVNVQSADGFSVDHEAWVAPKQPCSVWTPNVFRRGGRSFIPAVINLNSDTVREVRLLATSRMFNAPYETTVSFANGNRRVRIEIPVDKVPGPGGENLSIDLGLDSGMRCHFDSHLVNASARRLGSDFEFTGNWPHWEKVASPICVRPAYVAEKGAKYAGKADLDAEARIAWSDRGLYVGVKVQDDEFFQPYSNQAEAPLGDSLQVALSCDGISGLGESIVVAKLPESTGCTITHKYPKGEGNYTVKYTQLGEKEGLYEILMPWSRCLKIRENGEVLLSLFVNDNDGEGRKGGLELHSGIHRNTVNPDYFYGRFFLEK